MSNNEHSDCDRQLNEAEDRIIMLNKVIGDLNGRIAELKKINLELCNELKAKIEALMKFHEKNFNFMEQTKQIKELRALKCPPISDGDTCICPIEEQAKRIEQLERPLKAAGFKFEGMLAVGNELNKQDKRIKELEEENAKLEKWQIKPTEAICLTDLACRWKKVFKND